MIFVLGNLHILKKVSLALLIRAERCRREARRWDGKPPNVPAQNVSWPNDPRSAARRKAGDQKSIFRG